MAASTVLGLFNPRCPSWGVGGWGRSFQPAEEQWACVGVSGDTKVGSDVFLFTVVAEWGAAFCYAGLRSSVIKAETPVL